MVVRPKPTVEKVMDGMGFPDTEIGPYVTSLRSHVEEQIDEGLFYRSPGTWMGDPTFEERAKSFLAVEWEIKMGHCARCRSIKFEWSRPWISLGDQCRKLVAKSKKFWHDCIGLVNPYK